MVPAAPALPHGDAGVVGRRGHARPGLEVVALQRECACVPPHAVIGDRVDEPEAGGIDARPHRVQPAPAVLEQMRVRVVGAGGDRHAGRERRPVPAAHDQPVRLGAGQEEEPRRATREMRIVRVADGSRRRPVGRVVERAGAPVDAERGIPGAGREESRAGSPRRAARRCRCTGGRCPGGRGRYRRTPPASGTFWKTAPSWKAFVTSESVSFGPGTASSNGA